MHMTIRGAFEVNDRFETQALHRGDDGVVAAMQVGLEADIRREPVRRLSNRMKKALVGKAV